MIPSTINSFYQRRIALVETSHTDQSYTGNGSPSPAIQQVWQSLLKPTFDLPPVTTPLRAASICIDGTPVVFSVKLTHQEEAPAFRVLVEPGGTGITVPQQINCSLKAADELLQIMGWQAAAEQVNRIIQHVFPANSEELENWWGGIWLGTSVAESHTELRMYLNLRHGNIVQRWQRVADVLTEFGDESLQPVLQKLINQTSAHAIPVGLGIVISNTVRGIRLYCGMHEPNEESILHCISGDASLVKEDIGWFCHSIVEQFGDFTRQSVTLGYDFHLDKEGNLQPLISRTKIDVACQRFAKAEGFSSFLEQMVQEFKFDNRQLPAFLADLDHCFSGSDVEYISLGIDGGIDHLTVYAKPHSCKPAGAD